jgi:high-affinity iron transporter
MRRALTGLVMVCATAALAQSQGANGWHRVVGLLQYLEGDYAAALAEQNAEELEEQKGLVDEAVVSLEKLGPDAERYLERARQLQRDIIAHRDAPAVVSACHALAADIVVDQGLTRSPSVAPDLSRGKQVFEAQCASCHGADGKGDGPAGVALTPKPANFHDAARMETLTPYKVFNTTTFGITGTPMPGFPSLSDADRWAVAFFLFSLRQPACDGRAPGLTLEQLATSTDVEVLGRGVGLACARRVMPVPDEDASLGRARTGLEDARRFAAQGRWGDARGAVVDAYLLGLEPIEPTLRARAPETVDRLERGFTRARVAAQQREGFEAEVTSLLAELAKAKSSARGDFWSVFIAALFILLREGFEATVVVGALLAVMKKVDAPAQVRAVHVGWISALVFGVVAFLFGQALLAGANREWLETVVALGAVVLLLYAALWLNARSNLSAFMGEMRTKMKDALGRGSTVGLFFISFTSVGRETVETALFLQGLATDSRDGVVFGSLAGGVLLLLLVLFVRTVGFRLPMKTLFNASTVLLVATAVMLLGKGLHGLQELGVLPLAPMPFLSIAPLGLYPDWITSVPQLLLALTPLGYWAMKRLRPAPPVADTSR